MAAVYAIHYDNVTGEILSFTAAQYGGSGDLLVNALPSGYSNSAFRVKIDDGTPLPYLIKRENGYAYDINGQRSSANDENADEETTYDSSGVGIAPRGISLGGGGTSVTVTTTTEDEQSGTTTTTTDTINVGEENESYSSEDVEYVQNVANESLAKIATGQAVLCSLVLDRDSWTLVSNAEEWKFPAASIVSPRYVLSIEDASITDSTVLTILGLTRQHLSTHIYWTCEAGRITFETASLPKADVAVYCYLMATGDEWSAYGIIEAWPGADLVAKRYRHSLHAANDLIDLNDGEAAEAYVDTGFAIAANASVNVQTPLDFSAATLLFATPEWTGNSHVIIPHFYVNESDKFCYTLTNLGSTSVRVSEVVIRLMYRGVVSGMITDNTDVGVLTGYIPDEAIDELTE